MYLIAMHLLILHLLLNTHQYHIRTLLSTLIPHPLPSTRSHVHALLSLERSVSVCDWDAWVQKEGRESTGRGRGVGWEGLHLALM